MFYAQKYSLLTQTKRPIPGGETINTFMYHLIYFAPAIYSLGNFCLCYVFNGDDEIYEHIGVNAVSFFISVLIILTPFNSFAKYLINQ